MTTADDEKPWQTWHMAMPTWVSPLGTADAAACLAVTAFAFFLNSFEGPET